MYSLYAHIQGDKLLSMWHGDYTYVPWPGLGMPCCIAKGRGVKLFGMLNLCTDASVRRTGYIMHARIL